MIMQKIISRKLALETHVKLNSKKCNMKAENVNFGSLYKNKEMSNIVFVAGGRIT